MQQRNPRFIVFMLAAFGFMLIWMALHNTFFPQIPLEDKPDDTPEARQPIKPPPMGLLGLFGRDVQKHLGDLALRESLKDRDRDNQVTETRALVTLGSVEKTSPYHLGVQLDPRGAGVRSVLLNRFPRQDEDGRPTPGEFELVPAAANDRIPANTLYHYANLVADQPVDDLARVTWTASPIREEKLDDGRTRQVVEFTTEVDGVEIVKRFGLAEREYHLDLAMTFTRKVTREGRGANRFRYQLTARGLPIEGKWYTNIFRTSLIAQEQNGLIFRDYQDVRQIGVYRGGNEVLRDSNKIIRYAGITVQYFASVVVVDPAEDQSPFIARVRPTLERSVMRGTIKTIAPDQSTFVLNSAGLDYIFHVRDWQIRADLAKVKNEVRASVTSSIDRFGNLITEELVEEFTRQSLWEDDITVRLTSEILDLEKDRPVTHKFLLYNGPVKPSLLGQMKGDAIIPPEVVSRYVDQLKLNTLTDFQSPGWIGSFSNSIYWTHIVIACTNLMHWVLHHLYTWVPNYGLCVILLTVLVRGMMFPLSLKQAKTMMKMQALAPELKAMQEKYKDDRQGMAQAQMDLYRKHNVNPFGTCWVILLQMPVFMGLWYALQESIFFRLAPFWPTYIVNLAAPDMLWHWGREIPIISRDYDYGGFLYLGPYLNLMPLFAVALMLVQQKMMTPPPTNEQEEANQRVMTIMMCVMGLLFYKIAAGVCIYFVASSLWGVAERQFLPKAKKTDGKDAPATTVVFVPTTSAAPASNGSTATPSSESRGRSRKTKKGRPRVEQPVAETRSEPEAVPTSTLSRFAAWWRARRKAMSEWWAEIRRQAEKK